LLDSRAPLAGDGPEGDPISTLSGIERTSEPARLRIGERLRELFAYRETLLDLVRKELKVKYTASVLGAVWSLLNPVVFLAVFSFVTKVLNNRIPDFPVFLLSGLLVWNFFAASSQAGSRSVIDNANLVKKVAFPREILPLSSVGVALFDLLLQSVVLWAFIVISGHGFRLGELWLYPFALVTLLVFTTAATLWLAALNVRYRDVGHLLGLGLLVWFWLTPIVYQGYLVQREFRGFTIGGIDAWTVYVANPLATIVLSVQRALYGAGTATPGEPVLPTVSLGWHAATLGILLAIAIGLLILAWRSFFDRSGDFAEEL
jgi:ABC-2 type transport system permease protein